MRFVHYTFSHTAFCLVRGDELIVTQAVREAGRADTSVGAGGHICAGGRVQALSTILARAAGTFIHVNGTICASISDLACTFVNVRSYRGVRDGISACCAVDAGTTSALVYIDVTVSPGLDRALWCILTNEVVSTDAVCITRLAQARVLTDLIAACGSVFARIACTLVDIQATIATTVAFSASTVIGVDRY